MRADDDARAAPDDACYGADEGIEAAEGAADLPSATATTTSGEGDAVAKLRLLLERFGVAETTKQVRVGSASARAAYAAADYAVDEAEAKLRGRRRGLRQRDGRRRQ
jgi:hypothetical protein